MTGLQGKIFATTRQFVNFAKISCMEISLMVIKRGMGCRGRRHNTRCFSLKGQKVEIVLNTQFTRCRN